MTSDELRAVGYAAMWKLVAWDLRPRERLLGAWIVRLSLLSGRASVWIYRQHMLAELTGIDESDVADALRSLERRGVLQRAGDRAGAKLYTFLPNAELVQPEGRVPDDVLARVMRQIERDNAHGPDSSIEPGGQLRAAALEPADSRLAGDLASASRERALEEETDATGLRPWSPEWTRLMCARSMGLDERGDGSRRDESDGRAVSRAEVDRADGAAVSNPARVGGSPTANGRIAHWPLGESPTAGAPAPRVGVRAPETSTSTFTIKDDHVDVAGAGVLTRTITKLPDANRAETATAALRAVWSVVPKGEFDPWQRRWVERCRAEPELVLGFAEDCGDRLKRGEKIGKPGAWIYRSVAAVCAREGRPWR